ncbi:MAG: hypothetical protein U0X39_00530 [Bacteroidales bacterium]
MKDRLFKVLGIEPEERSMVSMLLVQSVFLGVYYGAFDTSAHSLFLAVFDEKQMARAYVVSGFTGIILTATYTWLQSRMVFRNFATLNLSFITIATLVLWLILLLSPSKWIIFTVFVLFGPLNIMAMLGFWGTTGRLFSLRQGKRLFGLVDAGIVIGTIVSCYSIPVLLEFDFNPHNILLISTAAIMVASVLQFSIGNRYSFAEAAKKETKTGSGLKVFRTDRYIQTMGIFIALSVATAFFVMYSFMAVTRAQYPAEEDMARFLGLFTGSMMIFTLIVKVFAFSYLIRNYGLKTCLTLTPWLVGAFTLIAVLIGSLMGLAPQSTGFLIFFLLMALSRLFTKALKDSVESPSFKVIYQSVDEKIRFGVQSSIDGTVNEISALSSGLLLAGLGALAFIKLVHFSWVLFFIVGVWIVFAFRLYKEYRNTIRESLEGGGGSKSNDKSVDYSDMIQGEAAASYLLKSEYFNLCRGKTTIIERTSDRNFLEYIVSVNEQNADPCLIPALKVIASRKDADEAIRHRAASLVDILESEMNSQPATKDKAGLLPGQKLLAGSRLPQTTEILRLLRDNNISSKRTAILIIGKFGLTDMLGEVCDCLSNPGLTLDASKVIESFGHKASENLSRLYMSSSGNNDLSTVILSLLARTGSKTDNEFIFARLWSNSRQVKETAAFSLLGNNYRASEEERDRLHQLISDTAGIVSWNLSAQVALARNEDKLVHDELAEDTTRWMRFLFNLLAIAYDPVSVERIRENLGNGTVGSVNYALEMIDLVVDDSVKPRLIALLDVVPDEEKLKNLHHFYPREIPDYDRVIDDLLNRDYNLAGIWTRACILRTLKSLPGSSLRDTLTALLFSPFGVLREEAAAAIGRTDPSLFESVSARLGKGTRDQVNEYVLNGSDNPRSIYNKTVFLASVFPGVDENDLIGLADLVVHSAGKKTNPVLSADDSIIWRLDENNIIIDTYLLKRGAKDTGPGNDDTVVFTYSLPVSAIVVCHGTAPETARVLFAKIERMNLKVIS